MYGYVCASPGLRYANDDRPRSRGINESGRIYQSSVAQKNQPTDRDRLLLVDLLLPNVNVFMIEVERIGSASLAYASLTSGTHRKVLVASALHGASSVVSKPPRNDRATELAGSGPESIDAADLVVDSGVIPFQMEHLSDPDPTCTIMSVAHPTDAQPTRTYIHTRIQAQSIDQAPCRATTTTTTIMVPMSTRRRSPFRYVHGISMTSIDVRD